MAESPLPLGLAAPRYPLSRGRFNRAKSGARDLNPGPHGPEPAVSSRVPPVPSISSCTQLRRPSCPFVSSCVLLVPRMRDTSVKRIRLLHSLMDGPDVHPGSPTSRYRTPTDSTKAAIRSTSIPHIERKPSYVLKSVSTQRSAAASSTVTPCRSRPCCARRPA